MTTESDLRAAISAALESTDAPWRLNRTAVRIQATDAVMASFQPFLAAAYNSGAHDQTAIATEMAERARTNALHEAATMLKRHGHRTAVTRVHDLANTPTRPQPAPGPAGGQGTPTAPDTGQAPAGRQIPTHIPATATPAHTGAHQ